MTRSDSDWINDLFAAHTRDWTPPSTRGEACVLFAPISRDAEVSSRCESILSPNERVKADKFLVEEAKARFVQRRAFRRYCAARALGSARPLSQFEFSETDNGGPYLPQAPSLSFGFSSCRLGFIAAWSSTLDVGVDIEDQTRNVAASELAQRYFSKAEAIVVANAADSVRAKLFFRLWTLKEAALKSVGEGLPFGLDTFEFAPCANPHLLHAPHDLGGPERFRAHSIEVGDHCAALVTAGRVLATNGVVRSTRIAG